MSLLTLKVVGQDDSCNKVASDGSKRVRLFVREPGHYSMRSEDGKWTLHKLIKDEDHFIVLTQAQVEYVTKGGKILVDEDILEMEN